MYSSWWPAISQTIEKTSNENYVWKLLFFFSVLPVVCYSLMICSASFYRIWLPAGINSFADACNTAGMKISTAKTEVLHLSRSHDQCLLQVNGETLAQVEKFKYFGVAFTSDGRQDEELDTQISKPRAVMRALHYSVVMKRELSKKAKLSICKAVFVPILTYGHESWVMTKWVRSQVQASEMSFLQKIKEVALFNKVRS